jgi:hypothetical protein
MTTPLRRPAGRYDERRPLPRRVTAAIAGVAGVALLLLVVVAFQRFGPGKVQGRLLSYEVVDDHTVVVRFEVRSDPGTTATCLVRALARDMSEVASEEVRVGPSGEDRVVRTRTLTTSGRAVAAELVTCRL